VAVEPGVRMFKADKGHMSEHDNIELVKRCYSAFAQGHIQQALEMFGDDLDFQHPMPQSIWPWRGGAAVGRYWHSSLRD
jgi:ketosteroid isomerase-like protein